MADLDLGDPAPDFDLPRDGGGTIGLASLRGRPVVLYFYPQDDTTSCTSEAIAFSHLLPEFQKAGASGLNPFELLGTALDRLVDAGAMPPERRPGAEYLAWAAVHGMAMMAIDGPLRGLDDAQLDALGQRLLDMVERGL